MSTARRYLRDTSEAQAMADFLWNEKRRHLEDIKNIDFDLWRLETVWKVTPRQEAEMGSN